MNLNPQELAKVRKSSLHSVALSSEIKATVVDAKLKELISEIKKVLTKKNASVEVLLLNFQI
jgi:predicted metal-dependent peptidase